MGDKNIMLSKLNPQRLMLFIVFIVVFTAIEILTLNNLAVPTEFTAILSTVVAALVGLITDPTIEDNE